MYRVAQKSLDTRCLRTDGPYQLIAAPLCTLFSRENAQVGSVFGVRGFMQAQFILE